MSIWKRIFGGALVGALLALILHPHTRPFYLSVFDRNNGARFTALLPAHQPVLPNPDSPERAAAWIQVGAEKLEARQSLTKSELASLISLAAANAANDPLNAYWLHIVAAFQQQAGDAASAEKAWERAATLPQWNDYQNVRLLAMRTRMANLVGAEQSWQLAYVYVARSLAPSLMIERFARAQIARSDFNTAEGINARYLAVRNGDLIRRGAKSLAQGAVGARIIDIACYPPELSGDSRPKRLYVGQTQVARNLRIRQRDEDAAAAVSVFRENGAWYAMTQRTDPGESFREAAIWGLAYATFPSAFLVIALMGLPIFGAGRLIERSGFIRNLWGTPLVAGLGVVISSLVFWLTQEALVSMVVFLSVLFLLVRPRHLRKSTESHLGPLFEFLCFLVAVLSIGAFMLHLCLGNSYVQTLLPAIDVPNGLMGDQAIYAGIALLLGSVLCVIAPLYALVYRVPTRNVLAVALQIVGRCWIVIGVIGALMVGPALVYQDRTNEGLLGKLVTNEPVYYLR